MLGTLAGLAVVLRALLSGRETVAPEDNVTKNKALILGEGIREGIGFNPRGNETQIYSVENTDLCLVATAEITLGRAQPGHLAALDETVLQLAAQGLAAAWPQ